MLVSDSSHENCLQHNSLGVTGMDGHQSRRKQHIPWRRWPDAGRCRKGFPTAPLSANYKVKPMFAAGVVADDEPTRRAAGRGRSAKERELAG